MQNIELESHFENHIRDDIIAPLLANYSDFQLYNFKKAVDILIAKNGDSSSLFFIEVKYHKNSHGRLGFGQGEGAGFQPEVLRNRTTYFETNMRWILGSEDSEEYWIADNDLIRQYLNGDAVGKKYNGIKKRFFREVPSITRIQLITQLSDWLFD